MTETAYTSAPYVFDVPITTDPGVTITDFTGGSARVDAINKRTSAKVAGTATITAAKMVHCVFAAGVLPVGQYSVQVLVTAPGGAEKQVVAEFLLQVYPGAAP